MKNLYKALNAFQNECPSIYKEAEAGSGNFKYKYVELPAIIKIITPLLTKHGLGFYQSHFSDGDLVGVSSTVYHIDSGETLTSKITSPIVTMRGMNDYQSLGSLSTYLRRYDLSTILGLVTEKDTDAQGEQVPKVVPKQDLIANSEPFIKAVAFLEGGGSMAAIEGKYNVSPEVKSALNNA